MSKTNATRKMKEVTDAKFPSIEGMISAADLSKGDKISGVYEGSFPVGKFNTPAYKIRVEGPTAATKRVGEGDEMTFEEITVPAGGLVGVYGTTVLNDRFSAASPAEGTYVAITYLGEKAASKKGRNPTFLFKLEVEDTGDLADADDESDSL